MNAIRIRIGRLLECASNFCERHSSLVLLLLVMLYIAAALQASRSARLWHDELFTYYIAQSPTLRDMWANLRQHDLNPPLMYLLTRWSFRLFGVSTLTTRIPEILGFMLWIVCTFRFVQRRMGTNFAAFAVLALLESDTFQFSVDARPYALLLGFLGLAMLGYQKITIDPPSDNTSRSTRLSGLTCLFVGVFGMMLSHMFGLFGLGALAAAEIWRTRLRRSVDWPVILIILLPLALFAAYVPMFRNHSKGIFPAEFQPNGETIFSFYIASISRPLVALCLTALSVLVLLGPRHLRSGPPTQGCKWFFTRPEWVLLIATMSTPLILMGYLMGTQGAFFPRYGAIATIGFVILATALLARWTMNQGSLDGRAALLGGTILFLMSGFWFPTPQHVALTEVVSNLRHSEPSVRQCQACSKTEALDPTLPLVDASGLTFIEMNHQETPSTLARVYYLTDPQASFEFAHANIFEQMPALVESFHLHGHAVPYSAFLREHQHFFVLGRYNYPEDWLLRKLTKNAEVRIIDTTADDYRDTDLYEVTIKDR
ncbi:MAG TPA: glycosyltransferase family 39 protein [Acidobacteriaceae bacterium]|nr:glycosyltransferase family 39 protein [Acidobacteriaceae bacterium]